MSALLAPIAGAVVGTSLLYGLHAVQQARTDQVIASIEGSRSAVEDSARHLSESKERAAQAQLQDLEAKQLRAPMRYRAAERLSVTEELRDRWNTHLIEAIDVVSRVQWDIAATKAVNKVRSLLPSSTDEAKAEAKQVVEKVQAELSLR
ncbi:hypothetical protein V8E36_007912 [Tilletia maclaganii]